MVVDSSFLGTEHPLCLVRPWYMSEFPGLEYCWPPITEAVKWVRSISVSFWKSKTPTEKSSEVNFGKSKWKTKTKNVLLFNQRQNIKIKENKTRIKRSEFYKAPSKRIRIFLESAKFSTRIQKFPGLSASKCIPIQIKFARPHISVRIHSQFVS